VSWPPLHPMIGDRIESQRCPDCGEPGRFLRKLLPGVLDEWACPRCEPERFVNEEGVS
jgi:rubredoxin